MKQNIVRVEWLSSTGERVMSFEVERGEVAARLLYAEGCQSIINEMQREGVMK